MTRTGLAFSAVLLLMLGGAAAANVAARGDLADPTRPLHSPARPAPAAKALRQRPTLESVLVSPGRRVAVIDGRRMSEGDSHAGVRVWEIRPDGVVVSVDGSPRMVLEIASARMHKELR